MRNLGWGGDVWNCPTTTCIRVNLGGVWSRRIGLAGRPILPSPHISNMQVKIVASTRGSATSFGWVLFALPLLAPSGVRAWWPVGVELHVQLPFPSRKFIVFGLFLTAKRVPLNNRNSQQKSARFGRHQEVAQHTTCQPGLTDPFCTIKQQQ